MEKGTDLQKRGKRELCWNLGLMEQDRCVTGRVKEMVIQAPLGDAVFAPAFKNIHTLH